VAFCSSQNPPAVCLNTQTLPCFKCIQISPVSSSASSSSSFDIRCLNSTACTETGDAICTGLKPAKVCVQTGNLPCFRCDIPTLAPTPLNPIINPPITTLVPPPVCTCPAPEKCVADLCVSPEAILTLPTYCGNARIDRGEQCDEGSINSNLPNAFCRQDCSYARCGDGIIDTPLEVCDDGNTRNNDGCSSLCRNESNNAESPSTIINLPFIGNTTPQTPAVNPTPPQQTPLADSGPASVVIIISGAAAGYAWARRKRRK